VAAPVPEKFEEFCLEVEDCPDASLAEIASRLGLSLKTARRYRKKYEQILKGDFIRIDDFSGRAIRFLLWLSQCRSPVSTAKARAFFCTEFEAGEKTFRRFLNRLRHEELIEETAQGWQLGKKILPRLTFTFEELESMIRFIQGYEAKGPLGRELKAVLTKLWMSMTDLSPRLLQRAAKRQARLVIKGPLCQQSAAVLRVMEQLAAFVAREQMVTFTYTRPKETPTRWTVLPCYVVYNLALDRWYLAGVNQEDGEAGFFRLDRIVDLAAGGALAPGLDPAKCERLKYAIGAEDGALYEVKIRFGNDFNVQDKVRRDAALRPTASVQEEAGGSLLYTDMVAGLGEISRWVRQFGASAKVLAPVELQEIIIAGARRKLARYKVETRRGGEGDE